MDKDIINGKQYVCLNHCVDGLINVPLHSVIVPFQYDPKVNSVRFNVTEPGGKEYDAMTNIENFIHMFKPEDLVRAWKEVSARADALMGE